MTGFLRLWRRYAADYPYEDDEYTKNEWKGALLE
jgi:hypothetical protein